MDTLIASLISGSLALIGTIITVRSSQRKTQSAVENTMRTEMAIMNTKLENLTKEVEKHNSFAVRIPKLEEVARANKEAIQRLESFHME